MKPTAPRRHRWGAALVATLALLGASPARAAESAPDPAIGIAIAELGNRALQQIRRELAQALLENARPHLPAPPTPPLAANWDTAPTTNTP